MLNRFCSLAVTITTWIDISGQFRNANNRDTTVVNALTYCLDIVLQHQQRHAAAFTCCSRNRAYSCVCSMLLDVLIQLHSIGMVMKENIIVCDNLSHY